jgi:hypothetical protein
VGIIPTLGAFFGGGPVQDPVLTRMEDNLGLSERGLTLEGLLALEGASDSLHPLILSKQQTVQGYLASEKTSPPRTLQQTYACGLAAFLGGRVFSYERGTPVNRKL